jgi:hypothetical protein
MEVSSVINRSGMEGTVWFVYGIRDPATDNSYCSAKRVCYWQPPCTKAGASGWAVKISL